MAAQHTGTPSPYSNRLLAALGVLLIAASLARGYPTNDGGRELDSAVDGVQKYLESSGFPKMTRGEVLDFLADFSRNARVSRSENAKKRSAAVTASTPASKMTQSSGGGPRIPAGESPLSYGYPMSSVRPKSSSEEKAGAAMRAIGAAKKSGAPVGPSVDLNAYAKFKKIPEPRNLKIDDDMRSFLGGFGLVDGGKTAATTATTTTTTPRPAQKRSDDDAKTDEQALDDVTLLRSVLHETGMDKVNNGSSRSLRFPLLTDIPTAAAASNTRDHVFNPSDPDVRTVDVNRIAKIVQNIRLLADDNDTVSLSQEAIQKKLENITAAIAAIDDQGPQAAAAAQDSQPAPNKAFDGYEVFFDDEDSKEVDSDLPEAPTGSMTGPGADVLLQQLPLNHKPAHYPPPDPLSTDELQHLLEKNKHDVKRQQPAADETTSTTTAAAPSTSEAFVTVTAVSMDAAAAAAVDSSSEAATVSEATVSEATAPEATAPEATAPEESTSDANSARDSSTAAASDVGTPSLSQLAESFGGGETASSAPAAEEETAVAAGPDRPKSGLYFYVDWNSFLSVNSGQKNQVNLRFAPKAGNAKHFIKVNVP